MNRVASRGSKNDYSDSEKRAPIRPRECMKDIIYNGVGIAGEDGSRTGSRVDFDLDSVIIITLDHKVIIIILQQGTDIHHHLPITLLIH